jgi:hypothetical protein
LRWKRSAAATLDIGMEEIGGGGTDVRPTQIVLVFDAGGNCAGDTALMNPSWLVGRCTLHVGTQKDGYVRNVPLPRVPQRQSPSHMTSHELIAPKAGIPIPGYLHVPSWIPTLPKLGSILGSSGLARDYSDLFPQ